MDNSKLPFITLLATYIPDITSCKVESNVMGKFLAPLRRVGQPIPAEAVKRLGSSNREENPSPRRLIVIC